LGNDVAGVNAVTNARQGHSTFALIAFYEAEFKKVME
jgi:hypothetical protein